MPVESGHRFGNAYWEQPDTKCVGDFQSGIGRDAEYLYAGWEHSGIVLAVRADGRLDGPLVCPATGKPLAKPNIRHWSGTNVRLYRCLGEWPSGCRRDCSGL